VIEHLWKTGAKQIDEQGHGYLPDTEGKRDYQATRLAAIATIADAQNPALHASDLAIKILAAHRDPAELTHRGDLSQCISEVSITSWLLAYWRLSL